MSADAVRALVARQRVRNHLFVIACVAAALLDAAHIVVLVAAASRAFTGVVVSLVVIAVVVAVSIVDAARSAGRVHGALPDAEQSGRLGPIVTGLAEDLGVEVPALWIADEDVVNALFGLFGQQSRCFPHLLEYGLP